MGPQTETVEFPSSSKSSEKSTVQPACLAARLMSASENEKLCNRWKIDSGQDIIAVGTEDIELRQEFELQSESQGLALRVPPQNILAEPASRQHHYHYECVLLRERGALRHLVGST